MFQTAWQDFQNTIRRGIFGFSEAEKKAIQENQERIREIKNDPEYRDPSVSQIIDWVMAGKTPEQIKQEQQAQAVEKKTNSSAVIVIGFLLLALLIRR